MHPKGFPGGSVVKNLPANAGDAGLIPGSGRSLGGGNGNSLQYPCLENPKDRGAWWTSVCGVAKSQTQLSNWAHLHKCSQKLRWWKSENNQYSSPISKVLSCLQEPFNSSSDQIRMGNHTHSLHAYSHDCLVHAATVPALEWQMTDTGFDQLTNTYV